VASGQQTESIPVDHPVLGPGVSIYADRRQIFGVIFLYLALIAISVVGVVLGAGDLTGGGNGIATFGVPGPVVGVAEIAAAVVVSTWSIRATIFAIGRIRQPITLVVGRDGFEYVGGHGPVGWDEVSSVGEPAGRNRAPGKLTVQLADPHDYAVRHALSPFARVALRFDHYDLAVGHAIVMPLSDLQSLMRRKLADFRAVRRDRVGAPRNAREARAPKRRRASPKK
jgi:hypothetical protein